MQKTGIVQLGALSNFGDVITVNHPATEDAESTEDENNELRH
jgi:hypothetical protein